MKKIISIFQRNNDGDKLVRDELVPGAEWVANGEGVATRKYDGTCCLVREGRLWKRYELKSAKLPPQGFVMAQDPDPVTGDIPGWLPVGDGPDDAWHREAFRGDEPDGTYELCGQKVQKNLEQFETHRLVRHGAEVLDAPRTFDALRAYLTAHDIEGIVWHHPDGRMVKIKGRDFGIKRSSITRNNYEN